MPVRNENTRGITGWCLEPHDLVLAKLVAGRDKDLDYAREALRHRLVARRVLEERLAQRPIDAPLRAVVAARIAAAARRGPA